LKPAGPVVRGSSGHELHTALACFTKYFNILSDTIGTFHDRSFAPGIRVALVGVECSKQGAAESGRDT